MRLLSLFRGLVLLVLIAGCDTSRPPEGYRTSHPGSLTFLPETTPFTSSFTNPVLISITSSPDIVDAWEIELPPCSYQMRRASEELTSSDGVLVDLFADGPCTYSAADGREVELTLISADAEWQPADFYADLLGGMTIREPDGTLVATGTYEASYSSQ